jgi:hypothetical protein
VQSTFNRNMELVYRSSFGRLSRIYYDQASQQWFNTTGPPNIRFGPVDPRGIPGFAQGNRGAPGDFEIVVMTKSAGVQHWTKHNSSPWTHPPGTWYFQETVTSAGTAGGPGLVSSRLNLSGDLELNVGELHYVCAADTRLLHFRRTSASASWAQVDDFSSGAGTYSGPCMIETLNAQGDELGAGPLELFVETGGQVEHWRRPVPTLTSPSSTWQQDTPFGVNVKRVIGALQGSSSLLEVFVERTDNAYQGFTRSGMNWIAGPLIA